mgnify:FL=1
MYTTPAGHFPRLTRRDGLALGLTAIFIAYFLVWLPGPGAGLSLIGVELGEWIKFLGVGGGRNWFYVPPITLGLLLTLWTATWPNRRARTWLARGLAVAVALLAFPAVAAITSEPPSEWLLRLVLIGAVAAVAVLAALLAARPKLAAWVWLGMGAVAVAGAVGPTAQYLAVRPVIAGALMQPLGIGAGVWFNALGHALVAVVGLAAFRAARQKK